MKHAAAALALLLATSAFAGEYRTNAALDAELKRIAKAGGKLVAVSELCEGVPLVQVGSGDPAQPATLVAAGLDGRALVGTEMALGLLADLAKDPDATRELLRGGTLYVLPRVNRAGAEAFFGKPRFEGSALPAESDHDKDGLAGEDGFDDLDGDGVIATVRVRDAKANMVGDGEILRAAKPEKGEAAEWLVFAEGRDNDGDKRQGEEADGGTNLGRNFTWDYDYFGRNSGRHQVCETETRAIADFFVEHRNIGTVVVFGMEDNLLASPKKEGAPNPKPGADFDKPLAAPHEGDVPALRLLGDRYRKLFGLKEEVELKGMDRRGGMPGWAYYHRGRLALATPGWAPELQLALAKKGKKDDGEEKKERRKRGAEKPDEAVQAEKDFVDWLKENNPGAWLGWKEAEHPDFPGKKAEIGGYAPFAKLAPPPGLLDDLATTHTLFVKDVLASLPRLEVREAELKPLAGGLAEFRVLVANAGALADTTAVGEATRTARATRIEIPDGIEVVGGPRRILLARIEGGGGWREARAIVDLKGGKSLKFAVVSESAGRIDAEAKLP